MAKRRAAPVCPYCSKDTVLLSGKDMYAHRPDLAEKQFWVCMPCDAYVGCEGKTTKPLGTPANAELRSARMKLHNLRLDPLWQHAEQCGLYSPEDPKAIAIIRNTARVRVYAYLAWKLGLSREECHTAQFDITECRRAWVALRDIDYPFVRDWYKKRNPKKDAA